jgi:5-dehydro-2-deoxygluconokinase
MLSGVNQPVYMLAADHRWQWDEWCAAHGVSRARIADTKALALDGLLAARAESAAVERGGALLIDQQYGAATVARAKDSRITFGTPAEKPGVFPLEWSAEPFWDALPGDFAKVLIRYRPEWPAASKTGQVEMLKRLAAWCRSRRQPLLLEVIIPRNDEPEQVFEATGRPALLATVISECYAAGVVPNFWKIEGTTDERAMRVIDAAIAGEPSARLLILGKGAGFDLIEAWFRAAAVARTAAGFAIGRSVYWQPAVDFLLGQLARDAAVKAIAANYLRVVAAWETCVSDAGALPGAP